MPERLLIERLEFQGHCGITDAERESSQTIAVDLELEYQGDRGRIAAHTGEIAHAVDYAKVVERVIAIGEGEQYKLLETLAERVASMVFAEFPVSSIHLWVRKVAPPVSHIRGSVGVRMDRTRASTMTEGEPAKFLLEMMPHLPRGNALDVAAGRGRNALYLAEQGYSVDAIDRDERELAELLSAAQARNLANLAVRTLDLEADPIRPPDLPKEHYEVILVFYYLYRPLFPALLQALKPGGVLVYETFLIDNHLRYHHPRRREFCLAHNELLCLASGLRILHYDEGEYEGAHGSGPAFTARLLARREDPHGPY